MAIDVFPVWRSPMINSRWPRPIGTRASMAFKPVWRGSDTDFRCITPGAGVSTGRKVSVTISPKPSTGWPSGLTTRPIKASPAGTSMILPVRRTESPSRISVKSPKMMIPTSVVSKFWAIPYEPFSKINNSPLMAFSSPWARAIPSPM